MSKTDLSDIKATSHHSTKSAHIFTHILLAIARVRVISPQSRYAVVRALLDQDSDATLISENLVQLLQLKKIKRSIRVTGIGDTISTVKHAVTINITPRDQNVPALSTTALVISNPTKYVPIQVEQARLWPHVSNLELADNLLMNSDPIEFIIGADLYGQLILDDVRKGFEGQPIAQNTILG